MGVEQLNFSQVHATTLSKKKTAKLTDEKVITLSADRELFGRLLITGKSRDINLRELLSYELSTVPSIIPGPLRWQLEEDQQERTHC